MERLSGWPIKQYTSPSRLFRQAVHLRAQNLRLLSFAFNLFSTILLSVYISLVQRKKLVKAKKKTKKKLQTEITATKSTNCLRFCLILQLKQRWNF